jgi:hypothetical protein
LIPPQNQLRHFCYTAATITAYTIIRSVANFIHLPEEGNNYEYPSYRLLRFIDGRDKRYTHLIDYKNPIEGDPQGTYHPTTLDWCQTDYSTNGTVGHVVLYIPGHEGQYKQARSIAAHGIGLSEHPNNMPRGYQSQTVEKLINGTMNKYSTDLQNFVYDVYTVDFGDEGGAYHASRLYAQVDFVIKSIEKIADKCDISENNVNGLDGITILSHSIGGLVARKVITTLHKQNTMTTSSGDNHNFLSIVKNVITLATPHQYIPIVLDQSMFDFVTKLEQEEKQLTEKNEYETTLVSFSAGLRDELISQQSAFIHIENSVIDDTILSSVLASDVMSSRVEKKRNGSKFGMDHKCVVWCHGLLSTIRELIHTMTLTSSDSTVDRNYEISEFLRRKMFTAMGLRCSNNEKNEAMCMDNRCSYECRTSTKQEELQLELGKLGSFAMQSTMLYNIRLFALLYSTNAVLYQVLFFFLYEDQEEYKNMNKPKMKMLARLYLCCPILSSCVLCTNHVQYWYNQSKFVIVLSFAAMNVYFILLYAFMPFLAWSIGKIRQMTYNKEYTKNMGSITPNSMYQTLVAVQMKVLVSSISIHMSICTLKFFVFGQHGWVWNGVSIISHGALVLQIGLIVDLLRLSYYSVVENCVQQKGCTSDEQNYPKINTDLKAFCRMLCTFLLPIIPMLIFGKWVYWSSLLTTDGQQKARKYIFYQETNNDFCSNMNGSIQDVNLHSFLCIFTKSMSRYDLGFVMKVSIPIYTILLSIGLVVLKYGSLKDDTKKSK